MFMQLYTLYICTNVETVGIRMHMPEVGSVFFSENHR